MLRKIMIMIYALLMCVYLSPQVYAIDQDTRTGSIELTFEDTITSEVSFSLYKIGDVADISYVRYNLTSSFSNLNIDLNNITTSEDYEKAIDECQSLISKNNIQPFQSVKGNEKGNVVFNNLELGMYFIVQDKGETRLETESLILTVPTYKENTGFVYDVKASPKFNKTPVTPETPKKPETPKTETKTGDRTAIMPYVVTLVVSGMFVLILSRYLKHE